MTRRDETKRAGRQEVQDNRAFFFPSRDGDVVFRTYVPLRMCFPTYIQHHTNIPTTYLLE